MFKKRIKSKQPQGGERLKTPDNSSVSTLTKKPIFSLEFLCKNYCISKCNKEQKAGILDKLHKWSKLTWKEIINSPKNALGHEKIKRDSIKIKKIPTLVKEVYVLSTRFNSGKNKKSRLLGYRVNEIFYLLWIDKDGKLYEHGS
ncbi:hypothetical protein ACFLZV_04400 [Candidatus Margulisiibacteriota bacterium]